MHLFDIEKIDAKIENNSLVDFALLIGRAKILSINSNACSQRIGDPVQHNVVQKLVQSELLGQTAIWTKSVVWVGPRAELLQNVACYCYRRGCHSSA